MPLPPEGAALWTPAPRRGGVLRGQRQGAALHPRLCGEHQRAPPSGLPRLCGGHQRALPSGLPRLCGGHQRAPPSGLPRLCGEHQRAPPSGLPRLCGGHQRALPSGLPLGLMPQTPGCFASLLRLRAGRGRGCMVKCYCTADLPAIRTAGRSICCVNFIWQAIMVLNSLTSSSGTTG